MLAGKSRQRLEKRKKAKLVNNSTSNSREGISIYIPAASLTSYILYGSGFKLGK